MKTNLVRYADNAFRSAGKRINDTYHNHIRTKKYNTTGDDVFCDWDNLIVLDACRYDTFVSVWKQLRGSGRLTYRESRGSTTYEWLYGNFRNKSLSDTIYITANSMPYVIGQLHPDDGKFSTYYFDLDVSYLWNLWMVEEQDQSLKLPPNKAIMTPSQVSKHARLAEQEHYDKRLIIHYMQPHTPFLGPTGQLLHANYEYPLEAYIEHRYDPCVPLSINKIRTAYRENVMLAVSEALNLADSLTGKTVITADHGELLYEDSFPLPFKEVKHPSSRYMPELVQVPWLVLESADGKETTEEYVSGEHDHRQEMTNSAREHLRTLGYID